MAELTKKMAELLTKQKKERAALLQKERAKLQKSKAAAIDELINLTKNNNEFKNSFLSLIKSEGNKTKALLNILSEYTDEKNEDMI
jgi:hypothetical protein